MENNKKSSKVQLIIGFFTGVFATIIIVALVMCGIGNYKLVNSSDYNTMSSFFNEYKDLAIVDKAIDNYFYLEPENPNAVDAACKSVVESLGDQYSSYMTKAEFEDFMATSMGNYSGIGVSFTKEDDGNFVVMSVNSGSPAESAGIKPGDYITKVNGKEYTDMDLIASDMRGKEGTDVEVTYSRNDKEKTVTITRAQILQESVNYKVLDDGTGYIAITQFIDNTGEDFHAALKAIENAKCTNLVLDLRDNGGGLVDEAVDVADEFLDKGIVVYAEDKNGHTENYNSNDGKTDINTVILVNENSASSSEILAGALKDNGFKLVGNKTFGKGIIQSTRQFDSGAAIKLTTAQYFTPKGNKVHKVGIEPDYKVKNKGDVDSQLKKALELLK